MLQSRFLILAAVLALSCNTKRNEFSNPEITQAEIKYHVEFLASDSLRGRASGAEGNNIAAKHLADEFKNYGLKPAGDDNKYFQSFEIVTGLKAGEKNEVSFGNKKFELEKHFRPLAFSADTGSEGQLVFAGYGISSSDTKYDDFEKVTVKDKIVLIFRYTPEGDNPHSHFNNHAPLRKKVGLAAEKGAKGVLVVTGFEDGEDDLIRLQYEIGHGNYGIPAMSISREAAMEILGYSEPQFRDLQRNINNSKKPNSFETASTVKLSSEVLVERSQTQNVAGWLEGTDPELKKEYVIIGAHFDHLGMGGSNSMYRGEPAIHNGADDNASGTTALLELAQKLSTQKLRRSLLFIGFTGEEMGLIGSKYFAEHPTTDLTQAVTMFNFDMVGRLKENQLIIHGMGTSPHFTQMINDQNKTYNFALTLKQDGNGPSDFATFYQKDMPVIAYFTNLHADYHKPSDDADKINLEGEERIIKMAFETIVAIANADKRPEFTKVKGESERPMTGFRATLGIVPNYADDTEGLKIDDVNPGQAGDHAGIKKGDILVKFGPKTIKNVYDYTYALGEHKAGDKVDIIVQRGGKEIKLQAVLQKSKRQN
ncbi:M28 family peptidase [bacterium]|nr:MAG: M28 family peptidase [bacterium]